MMSLTNPNEIIAAYVPVISEAYIDLFDRYPEAVIGVLDTDILARFNYLRKDIRALSPEHATEAIRGFGRDVKLLGEQALGGIVNRPDTKLIMPDDDVSRGYFEQTQQPTGGTIFEPIFLRWDRLNTTTNMDVVPDKTVDVSAIEPFVIETMSIEATKSSNWWRHIGAIITKDSTILHATHNHSLPTHFSSSIDNDPRITQQRGESIETTIDIHAESKLIAEMAKEGVSLDGSDLYVSTFPCPNCARLIALAGIRRCYYAEGYAMIDGLSILQSAGVQIIKIEGFQTEEDPLAKRTYPS